MTLSSRLNTGPRRTDLLEEYLGRSTSDLPTPAFIIDEHVVFRNCSQMLATARSISAQFRPHVKTHKTLECTALQLGLTMDSVATITDDRRQIGPRNSETERGRVVVSTLMEAYSLLPLVEQGLIDDILYGVPIVSSRIEELAHLSSLIPNLRIMIDCKAHLDLLLRNPLVSNDRVEADNMQKWSVFIKIDMGSHRAGSPADSQTLWDLIRDTVSERYSTIVDLYGFYCHAGHSYSSRTSEEATGYLVDEIRAAASAAVFALELLDCSNPSDPVHMIPYRARELVISVGATPTAHAAANFVQQLATIPETGKGRVVLELHAGNYIFNDLQQLSTGLITKDDIAVHILADVVSLYPNRSDSESLNYPEGGEALVNAGVLCFGRETSAAFSGFGTCEIPNDTWFLSRLSQEHGIMSRSPTPILSNPNNEAQRELVIGDRVRIIPQHSCISAACFGWYYLIRNETVVDIWVPWKGW